jgi:hypothetical protein
MHGFVRSALGAAAVIAIAACSSSPSSTPASTSTTSAAQPETATAAKAAAARFFGLYSASQFAAAWTLLPPSTRRAIPQGTWVAVHNECRSAAAGLTFKITDVKLTGGTATVTYTLIGAPSSFSATQGLSYSQGQWWLELPDASIYQHGSVNADVAAAKARGECSGS